jgi:tetratricopeptide (TPR) repeat protein
MSDRPTQSAAAYEAYLRGITIGKTQTAAEPALMRAAAEYNEAVRIDPKFALAWGELGVVRSFLHAYGVDPAANTPEVAKAAVDQAMALAPHAGESWLAKGAYLYRVARDYPAALEAYREAVKYLPNNADALQQLAFLERRLSQWDASLHHIREAMTLDPRNVALLKSAPAAIFGPLRRFAECQATYDRILEIVPDDEAVLADKAYTFQREGRLPEARQTLERIPVSSQNGTALNARWLQLLFERRPEEALAQLQILINLSAQPGSPLAGDRIVRQTLLGYCQEWAQRTDEARQTFRAVVEELQPSPDAVLPVTSKRLRCQLALAYAGLREKEKALAQASQAVEEYRNDAIDGPFAKQILAQIHARFGDADAAIAALPHLLEVPAGITHGNLRVDPFWDPLRGDPRFKRIVSE